MNATTRRRVEVFEMNGLRAICKLRRVDRVRNNRIKEMCEWKKSMTERAEQGVLRWFGHLIRMNEERIVKKVFNSEVDGERGRGRPKLRWMDGVSELLNRRGLGLQEGVRVAGDRREWRRIVHADEGQ